MSAQMNHTIDITGSNGYGRCGVVPVWISVSHYAERVFMFPHFYMSYSLTVREKEHWKDRIAGRIDKRIDALCAENGKAMELVKESSRERALDSLGISTLQKCVDRLKKQISSFQDNEEKTKREITAKLRGVPLRSVEGGGYGIEREISEAVKKRQTLYEDELLAESEAGQKILSLRQEKENLLDTVWLATSGKQIKDLWEKVDALLGNTQSALQREAMKIAPVEES